MVRLCYDNRPDPLPFVILLGTLPFLFIACRECLRVIWQALRFAGEPVVTRLAPRTAEADTTTGTADVITVVHWSDLHLTASDQTPTVEGSLLLNSARPLCC